MSVGVKICKAFGTVLYSVDVAVTFIKSIVSILVLMMENKNTMMVNLTCESAPS